jgi:hypothetical protein
VRDAACPISTRGEGGARAATSSAEPRTQRARAHAGSSLLRMPLLCPSPPRAFSRRATRLRPPTSRVGAARGARVARAQPRPAARRVPQRPAAKATRFRRRRRHRCRRLGRDETRGELARGERCGARGLDDLRETCPVSTEGGTRRVQLVREGGGRGGQRPRVGAGRTSQAGGRARGGLWGAGGTSIRIEASSGCRGEPGPRRGCSAMRTARVRSRSTCERDAECPISTG